jgi:ABC-2 type transport system permease protein
MRNIKFLLQKEFRQIFRNTAILRMILVMPILQLILIPLAADYEVKEINLVVVDNDHSSYSRRLVEKVQASDYFQLQDYGESYQKALNYVEDGQADLILTIPAGFERDLYREQLAELHIAADAVNGVKAGLGTAYAQQMVMGFQQELLAELTAGQSEKAQAPIQTTSALWYNPHINYYLFMVPGILAILITMVGSFLAALNIVAEKEIGTMEQLNVSPIKKYEFILGKLIPFWVIGLVSISIAIVVAYLFYGIWPEGSLLVIYSYSGLYLLAVLGIGLLLSTVSDNQQQATLFAFFILMVFILMGGLYTPVESMPEWAQWMAAFNPPTYFIKVIRAVYIKGSGFGDLGSDFLATFGFAVFFNALAIWNYRKRTN